MINMGILSILILLLVILVGFRFKINTGLLSILAAFILGFFVLDPAGGETGRMLSDPAGKAKTLLAGWDTSLLFMMLGTTFLFTIARLNNTLEVVANKVVTFARGKTRVIPLLFFFLCFVISAVGPGNIATCALMIPIAMAVAKEEQINPLLMAGTIIAGCNAGALSPIAPTGIVALSLSERIGLSDPGLGMHFLLQMFIAQFVFFLLIYIVLKGYRLPSKTPIQKDQVHLNKKQTLTLLVIGLTILSIVVFKTDVGFTGFTAAFVLLLFRAADEKQSILGVPWGTIVMVCGVGVLVNVISIAGGIDLIEDIFSSIMTPGSAPAIMALIGSLLSIVSSSIGVVLPTLIPTVPGVVENLSADPVAIVTGIIIGAHMVTTSPFSTMGGLAMATASSEDLTDKNKFYKQLLMLGFAGIVFGLIVVFRGFAR